MTGSVLSASIMSLAIATTTPVFWQKSVTALGGTTSEQVSYILLHSDQDTWALSELRHSPHMWIKSSFWEYKIFANPAKNIPSSYEEYRYDPTQPKRLRWPGITSQISEDITFVMGRSHTPIKIGLEVRLDSTLKNTTETFAFWLKSKGRIPGTSTPRVWVGAEYRMSF